MNHSKTKASAFHSPGRYPLTKRTRWLLFGLLLMALTLVYVKDLNRRLNRDNQRLHQQLLQAQTQWEKLLLEKAIWISPRRLENLASKYGMQPPRKGKVIVIDSGKES